MKTYSWQQKLIQNQSNVRQRTASAGKSFYIIPEGELCYMAALCNEACLDLNPKVRNLYIEIVDLLKRPGIRTLFQEDTIESENNQDFKLLQDRLANYILTAFNHQDFIDNPKINPSNIEKTWHLSWAVTVTAGVESFDLTFEQLDTNRMGENYGVMQNKTDLITNRADRNRRRRLKAVADEFGLKLVHEDGRYELAKLWYFARVIMKNLQAASGLGDCNGISIPVFSNTGTAYNKIHDFDIATGYS